MIIIRLNILKTTYRHRSISSVLPSFLRSVLLLLMLLLGAIGVSAQKINVASFKPLETDVTALTTGMKLDFSGNKCALIKVATTERDLRFEVGALGIVEREDQNDQHPAEIYLYVPGGVAKISIQHPELGSLHNYDLGGKLKPGRVYLLELTCNQVNTFVVDYNNEQMLLTKVFPKDASLIINGMQQPAVRPGEYETLLSFGTHKYRVSAPDYHPLEGTVKINSKDKAHELNIRLRQNYGYLSVGGPAKYDGSEIYLDDKMIGVTPIDQMQVKSGEYTLSIKRDLFEPFIQKLQIKDSVYTAIVPEYVENFGKIMVSAQDPECSIYVDGKFVGKADNSQELLLETGEHTIEVRREAHRTMKRKINVSKGSYTPYHLPVLVPICGKLQVVSDPRDAEVWVDGEKIGTAMAILSKVLIGEHRVTVKAKGYRPEEFTVNIEENKLTRIEKKLSDQCNFALTSEPSGAMVQLNGSKVGFTPMIVDVAGGTYDLILSKSKHKTVKQKITINGSTSDMNFKLGRLLTGPNEFYIEAGSVVNSDLNLTGALGLYLNDFNFEVGGRAFLNLDDTKIYWNRPGEETSLETMFTAGVCTLRAGYGVRPTRNMRITPRIGVNYTFFTEDYAGAWQWKYQNQMWCVSATVGAKVNWALTPWLGLSVNCDYLIPCKQSAIAKTLLNVSPTHSSIVKGVKIGLGLYFYL